MDGWGGWMDNYMDTWMNEWMDGHMTTWMDEWMGACIIKMDG